MKNLLAVLLIALTIASFSGCSKDSNPVNGNNGTDWELICNDSTSHYSFYSYSKDFNHITLNNIKVQFEYYGAVGNYLKITMLGFQGDSVLYSKYLKSHPWNGDTTITVEYTIQNRDKDNPLYVKFISSSADLVVSNIKIWKKD